MRLRIGKLLFGELIKTVILLHQIEWLNVGVMGGEEEVVLSGYVWQSDHSGIKVTWLASDPESGVNGIEVAVGTTPG